MRVSSSTLSAHGMPAARSLCLLAGDELGAARAQLRRPSVLVRLAADPRRADPTSTSPKAPESLAEPSLPHPGATTSTGCRLHVGHHRTGVLHGNNGRHLRMACAAPGAGAGARPLASTRASALTVKQRRFDGATARPPKPGHRSCLKMEHAYSQTFRGLNLRGIPRLRGGRGHRLAPPRCAGGCRATHTAAQPDLGRHQRHSSRNIPVR